MNSVATRYSIDVAGRGCLLIATRTNVFFETSSKVFGGTKWNNKSPVGTRNETKFSDCEPVCAPDSATNDEVR